MLKPLVFVVSAWAHPDLLPRIALLFHRLHVPVVNLTMQGIDSEHTRFTIEVFADPEISERIIESLAKIIYVGSVTRDVRKEAPPARPRRPHPRRVR
jgi:acetolactate synthase small subunit